MSVGAIDTWGRLDRRDRLAVTPRFRRDMLQSLPPRRPLIAHGLGRSYGDVATLEDGVHLRTEDLDRIMSFDPQTGVLRAEAGISLSAVLQLVVPHGWFLPTTPGSRFVTLGGAVANDVHGKNHHQAGTFGSHIRAIGLSRTNGKEYVLSPDHEAGLFAATVGGLGLTGLISWVEIQLVAVDSSFLDVETLAFENLEEFFEIAAASEEGFEHTVSWIDCLGKGERAGRGIFSRANWCTDKKYQAHDDRSVMLMPFEAPSFILNGVSVKAFNIAYRAAQMLKLGRHRTHYAPFFYPLDGIGSWNKLYGPKGFYQYQCVTPKEAGITPVRRMLGEIAAARQGSFLAVLKTFGSKVSPGLLSFPREGVTLALDFPNKGKRTLDLFERLDRIVAEVGGRLYPAKDARMPPALFRAGYPRIDEFLAYRDEGIDSDFARRIFT
ncbi:FAD-dependent oxidoreductase [Qipengyuania aquimaris]|uniref:FAD-binding oxidoreductase n=1 Tax=Qipengyuania aquimaris TaxID=255984 RepID=A0A9Q3XDU0_9SPHN|nr:FAD-binding oxidoreductase [Qipengyuania aquimaris]MBY6218096.1 FAD-binding oxidoreductase [Qipengyuania aquimaris]